MFEPVVRSLLDNLENNSKLFFEKIELPEIIHELESIKNRMEQVSLVDIKYFLKSIVPTLSKIFTHFTENRGNDPISNSSSYRARMIIMEIFLRMVYDEQLTEIYHIILNL